MNILITGASGGIGAAAVKKFVSLGHTVYGIDLLPAAVRLPGYTHYVADVRRKEALPELAEIHVIFNNAGAQNSGDDLGNNLLGAMNVTEKYMGPALRSVLFNASASAVSGQEFPLYTAAKAGLLGYMKHMAVRLAPRGVTCNAISPGGVLTPLNDPVVNDPACWGRIMDATPMKKWATAEEIAEWAAFLTLTNRSMSGQNLLIDNGEYDLAAKFVWPEGDPLAP